MLRHYRRVGTKIILDCDPGVDDALAIAYAVGSAELDLLGITTVAGNVGLDRTTANALRVSEFVGAGPVPVTAGSPRPLSRPAITATHVHGDDGLRGARLPPPVATPRPGHSRDFIIDTVMAAPGEVTLVATGPLTNIALALEQEPSLVTNVRDFVIMGGSSARGNVTPAAEFNIAADPEAAAQVFSAGWTVTMVGLDVTKQAVAYEAVLARIGRLGRLADDLVLPCLRSDPMAGDDAVHDVCAVAYVSRPALLGLRPARVEVETEGQWTSGMTVTDFRAAQADRNALVAMTIDLPAFWDAVLAAYSAVTVASLG
jgi:purine nucleosidase